MSHPRSQAKALLLLTALSLSLLAASGPSATWAGSFQAKQEQVDEKTIRDLIQQLGDEVFARREEASKRLAEIGTAATELLRAAAKDNPDAEIRVRAQQLVQSIGSKVWFVVKTFQSTDKKGPGVIRVAVTPDGKKVVGAGKGPPSVWDIKTGMELAPLPPRPGQPCHALAMSRDGSRVIIGCDGKAGHVYDLTTKEKVSELTGHNAQVRGVALVDGGKIGITGGWDQTIRVWNVENGKELRQFEAVTDMVSCLALSPDGKTVAAGHFSKMGGPGIVRLWDFEKGVEIRSMEGHTGEITSIAFSPDGKQVLSTSSDKTMRLWDVSSGTDIKRFEGKLGRVENAAFTPDGKRIISCGDERDSSLRMWDVQSGQQILQTVELGSAISGIAILPDGRHCVSSGKDGTVRLWEWTK
jgi:WD40 repeat protein